MSVLTNQTKANTNTDFYARAVPGLSSLNQFVNIEGTSVMNNNAAINFDISTNPALSNARIIGVADALFIQSPTDTIFSMPASGAAKVQIAHDATGAQKGLLVSTAVEVGSYLQLDGGVGNLALTFGSQKNGQGGASNTQAYYDIYSGASSGGGIQASTIQMFAYYPNAAEIIGTTINQVCQIFPNGAISTYQPIVINDTLTVESNTTINGNLSVSGSINNQTPTTYLKGGNITILPTNCNVNNISSLACSGGQLIEATAQGFLNWVATPGASDYIVFGWGAGNQIQQQLDQVINPAVYDGVGLSNAPISVAGVFETASLATNADLTIDFNVATPSNYAASITNFSFRQVGSAS